MRRGVALGGIVAFLLAASCGGSGSEDLFEGEGGVAGTQATGGKAGSAGSGTGGAGGSSGSTGSGGSGVGGSGGSGGGDSGLAGAPGLDAGEDASTGGSGSAGAPSDAAFEGNNPIACPPSKPTNGDLCNVFVNNSECAYGAQVCVCTISTWLCVP